MCNTSLKEAKEGIWIISIIKLNIKKVCRLINMECVATPKIIKDKV